ALLLTIGLGTEVARAYNAFSTPDVALSFLVFDPAIPGFPHVQFSEAFAISTVGDIAGTWIPLGSPDTPFKGFIRHPDGSFELVEASIDGIPRPTSVRGINILGDIVGFYQDAQGATHGYRRIHGAGFERIDCDHAVFVAGAGNSPTNGAFGIADDGT